jgi:DNA-binding transcriptional LysR family regulator
VKNLRLYVEVGRRRSFSDAAQTLGLTQSAASQRVRELEKRLDVQLIDRSMRPLGLTSAGELFLRGAQDLLARYDQLQLRVTQAGTQLDGQVRVMAIYSAGIALLSHVKVAFGRAYPDVNIELEYGHPVEVCNHVRERQCDVGIVSYPGHWRDVEVIALRDEVMGVVCAPDHALARLDRVNAVDLGQWDMIGYEPSLPVARQIKRYLRDAAASPHCSAVFDNVDTIKAAVAETAQFAILPVRTAALEQSAGTLAVIDLSPQLVRPLGIIRRKHKGNGGTITDAAGAFVDFLLKHAGPDANLQPVVAAH